MQRTSLLGLYIGALVACAGNGLACPDGTKATINESHDGSRRRLCLMEDGITAHGPVVDIAKNGSERLVGRNVRGKREGKWHQIDPKLGSTEAVYKDGKVDGRFTMRDLQGKKVGEQEFRMGQRHGPNTRWSADGTVTDTEYYEDGLPARTWERRENGIVKSRIYGDDGVLLSVDGQKVALPPAQLALPDGRILDRRECVRRAREFRWDGHHVSSEQLCLDVFEKLQLCADDDCRRGAAEDYMRR